MPSIDVTDVLEDPDFLDTITVTVTTRTIGANGRATDSAASPVTVSAVVTPAGQRLIQQSDGSLRDGAIEIYTTFAISGGTKTSDTLSRLPDAVQWHGRGYIVQSVDDWSAYGAGWWHATANLQDINPVA